MNPFYQVRTREGHDGYYEDRYYQRPVAATNGSTLISCCRTIEEFVECDLRIMDGDAPAVESVKRLVVNFLKPGVAEFENVSIVSRDKPLAARRTQELLEERDAEKRLYDELASGGKNTGPAKVEMERISSVLLKRTDAEFHALSIGPAYFDIRLIALCRKALQTRTTISPRAILESNSHRAPVCIYVDGGFIILMPFLSNVSLAAERVEIALNKVDW